MTLLNIHFLLNLGDFRFSHRTILIEKKMFFQMSMVPGSGFFKGSETTTVFEQLLLVLSWSKN